MPALPVNSINVIQGCEHERSPHYLHAYSLPVQIRREDNETRWPVAAHSSLVQVPRLTSWIFGKCRLLRPCPPLYQLSISLLLARLPPLWIRHPWSRSVLSSHSVVSICGVYVEWIFLWKNRWHLSTVISIRDRDRFDLYTRRVPIVVYPSLSLFLDRFFPFKRYIRKQVTGEINGCWQMCDWLYGDEADEAKTRVATSSGGKDTMTWGVCDTIIRAHCWWTNVESEHL